MSTFSMAILHVLRGQNAGSLRLPESWTNAVWLLTTCNALCLVLETGERDELH